MNAWISSRIAPLYREASESSELVDEGLYGMGCEILSEEGEWAQVEMYYRYRGHCRSSCLKKGGDPFGAPRATSIPPFLDVHAEPAVRSAVLSTLPRGGMVWDLGASEKSGWEKVGLVGGGTGFAMRPFLDEAWSGGRAEGDMRDKIAKSALSYLGTQYRWGGKSAEGIDCSGLSSMSYLLAGSVIYRDAKIAQGFQMHEIPFEEIQKGDLVFYKDHVVLYLGGRRYIHSTAYSANPGVVINSFAKGGAGYRADLDGTHICCGSVF